MKVSLTSEKIFLFIFALILFCQMFIPPVVGLADNGDFTRIMDKVGIQPGEGKEYMGNINLTFPIRFSYNFKGYQSSELLLVLTSIFVNSITSKDGSFHLLTLGAVHFLALLASLAIIAYAIARLAPRIKWLIYICILVIFTDVGYVSYLNSIYSEPASLIFLALTIAMVLFIAIRSDSGEVRFGWALAFFASALLFVMAKPQNAAMGIPLAVLGFWLMRFIRPPRLLEKWRSQLAILFSLGLVTFSFLLFAFGLPKYYRSGDLWNSVFLEIVGKSQQPEQDLAELGLPPEMIAYKGTTAFSEGVNRNVYADFQHSWLYFKILKFYLVHPGRLYTLINDSTASAFELQQANLGNFASSDVFGSYDKSQAFAVWNRLRLSILPKSIWTLVGLLILNLAAVILKLRRFDKDRKSVILSALHITIISMAVLQYLTVLLAEGTFELVKHMFLFNVFLDITFIFLIAYLGGWIVHRIDQRRALRQARLQPEA